MSDSDSTSSPIEEEVTPGTGTYLVRLTPGATAGIDPQHQVDAAFTKDEVKEFLNSYFAKWIIGTETDTVLHYHICCETDDEDPRLLFKTWVHERWPNRIRGFGSAQWNFQAAESPNKGISYALKWDDYEFHGYDPEFIKQRYRESFIKPKKEVFATELRALRERALADFDMGIHEICHEFNNLKAKFEQGVQFNQALAFANMIIQKREPEMGNANCSRWLERQGF